MAETPDRAGPILLTAANTAQAIVNAGGTTGWPILREILVANETGAAVVFSLGFFTSAADAAGRRIVHSMTLLAGDPPFSWGGYLPMKPSEVLYAICDTANGVSVTCGVVAGP